ncbi:hypothetical protein D9M72_494460 [compost metagenome]
MAATIPTGMAANRVTSWSSRKRKRMAAFRGTCGAGAEPERGRAEAVMIAQRHPRRPDVRRRACGAAPGAEPACHGLVHYRSFLRGRAGALPCRLPGVRVPILIRLPGAIRRLAHRVRSDGPSSNTCLFLNSACPTRLCVPWPNRATPRRLPSRPRQSPPFSRAVTCSPARRPAPARPPALRCRCCRCCPTPRRAASMARSVRPACRCAHWC